MTLSALTPVEAPRMDLVGTGIPMGIVNLGAYAQATRDAVDFVRPLMNTDFIPAHFRPKNNSPEAFNVALASATAAVLFGADLDLGPLQSLANIYVIGGKPAMYAGLMVAILQSKGHEIWTDDLTDARAVVFGQRKGSSHVERVIFTIDMARKAGYTRNKKYAEAPQDMLLARAQANTCRRVARDALLGIAYSAEEMQDEEALSAPAPAAPATRTMKRAAAPRAAQVTASDIPSPTPPTPPPAAIEGPPLPGEEDGPEQGAPTAPEPDPITAPQVRKLQTTYGQLGVKDRDEKLRLAAAIVGRDVATSNGLTKSEAILLIDQLEKIAALDAPDADRVLNDLLGKDDDEQGELPMTGGEYDGEAGP